MSSCSFCSITNCIRTSHVSVPSVMLPPLYSSASTVEEMGLALSVVSVVVSSSLRGQILVIGLAKSLVNWHYNAHKVRNKSS